MAGRRNPGQGQGGYTLIELIVAASIFILISVIAVGVLVSILRSSSKTAAQRSVQQDARVNIEEIARTVRASSVDYAFYDKAAAENEPNCRITSDATGTRTLALLKTEAVPGDDPIRKRVIFFYVTGDGDDITDNALYRYEATEETPTPSCEDVFGNEDRVRLTADNVATTDARFFVSPLSNPYGTRCSGSPPSAGCQRPRNTHPRVTLTVTVRTFKQAIDFNQQADFSQTTLQTTVGTRAYPITGLVGQPG